MLPQVIIEICVTIDLTMLLLLSSLQVCVSPIGPLRTEIMTSVIDVWKLWLDAYGVSTLHTFSLVCKLSIWYTNNSARRKICLAWAIPCTANLNDCIDITWTNLCRVWQKLICCICYHTAINLATHSQLTPLGFFCWLLCVLHHIAACKKNKIHRVWTRHLKNIFSCPYKPVFKCQELVLMQFKIFIIAVALEVAVHYDVWAAMISYQVRSFQTYTNTSMASIFDCSVINSLFWA